jgi:uncharacterized protein
MASDTYHEPIEKLTETTIDLHRAIRSLMEELEAIDWYQQRVDATSDEELKAIISHNRNEEIEHAMMTLEWIRRRHANFDDAMRTYLFTQGDVTHLEQEAKVASGGASPPSPPPDRAAAHAPAPPAVTIGSLKGR